MLQMTKEQSVRFTIAIHTVGQQYVLEWLSLANIKQTKWSGFFVEGIRNRTRTQLQKVILAVLMEKQNLYHPYVFSIQKQVRSF